MHAPRYILRYLLVPRATLLPSLLLLLLLVTARVFNSYASVVVKRVLIRIRTFFFSPSLIVRNE